MKVWISLPVLFCLLLASCDESTPADAGADTSVSMDSQAVLDTTADKKVPSSDKKVPVPDKKVTPPDQKVVVPDKKVTPPDKSPPPKLLAAKLTKLTCWCNKMPPGTSNIVMVEATLINGSKSPVTGVKAVKSSFQVVPSGLPQTITFKADPPFTGTVPGAGSASVKLRAQGTPALVPIPCKGTIKVTTSFSSSVGTIGPYVTAQATCQTVY